jgi:hypothetical protein
MTDPEEAILETLRSLEAAARNMLTTNPKPDLRPLFSRLNQLTAQLPPDTDPQLVHYLTRGSYEKARLHLEGRFAEIARGKCGTGSAQEAGHGE